MKKLSLLSVLLICLLLTDCKHAIAQVHFNGDFETINPKTKLPDGWTHPADMEKAYHYAVDSSVVQHGKYSFSMQKYSDSSTWGSTGFLIAKRFKGKEIELRGYLKTENVTGGYAGFWLRIDGTSAFNNMQDQNVHGTNDWKEFSIKLPYDDEKATQIYAGLILDGRGKMWADNLRLYIDGKPIDEAPILEIKLSKAQLDTAFSNSSNIVHIDTGRQQLINLTMLGQVWGFVKYHHPEVASGNFNMDAELFRVMPDVIKAKDNNELSDVLEKWIAKFGKPQQCDNCKAYQYNNIADEKADYGHLFDGTILKPSLTANLRYILDNSNITKSFYIEMGYGVGNPIFKNELDYLDAKYPDAGLRVLALYRYWNMIQYFWPDKHDIGRNWDDVLPEYLPTFINAANATQYELAAIKLISSIHDTHANLWGYYPAMEQYKGKFGLPVMTKFIDNKMVISGYYVDSLGKKTGLLPGDVVSQINGQAVDALIKKYLPITAASNYPTQLRDIAKNYLLRSNNKTFSLDIIRDDRKMHIDAEGMNNQKIDYSESFSPDKDKPGYYLINDGQIGYISPARFHIKDMPEIEKLFSKTKGIIVDMRCYPSDFMPFSFVPFIKTGDAPFAKFRIGDMSHPGYFTNTQLMVNKGKGEYKGRVIVIVNEVSQSSAEYTTMSFQSASNVKVIGTTTAGADGNVSQIILPGHLVTMISGLGVLYPDGTDAQRAGVKIDIKAEPTIKGIREGKDEVLDKAKELIMNGQDSSAL
jgi:C-terminal processing protease CtpA/Prc